MSVWKLAQSNLAGHRACFLIGMCGQCSTNSKDLFGPKQFGAKRAIQWLWRSTSSSEAGSTRQCKQEGLQPSLIALSKSCKQPGFGFVLTSAEKGVETINQGVELVNR